MKFNKKLFSVLILSILILISISSVSAVDYSLTNANIDIDVQDNGLLTVYEAITYHFDSSANGVYRDIPLKKNQSIENLEVAVDGAYAPYEIISQGSKERIKIYLYADEAHTKKISSGSDVTIYLTYDFTNVVKVYDDIAELQYKVWGEEWEESLDSLTATIHLPNDKKVEYWINPYYNDASSSFSDGTLTIKSPGVKEDDYLEARILIPLKEFSSTEYAQHVDGKAADKIRKMQEDDKNSKEALTSAGSIIDIILVALCSIPLGIYYKFGREPKTDYQGIYEHEPPTNDPPAFVNALMGSMTKSIGNLDQKAFQATIMDMINKGNLGVDSEDDTEFTKTTFLTIKSTEGLKDYELELIDILRHYELNGRISFSYMQDCLRSESEARDYQNRYDQWTENFKNRYLPDSLLREYFDDKGYKILQGFGIVALILGILVGLFSFFFEYKGSFITLIIAILFAILGLVLVMLPSGIGGKYTIKGMEYAERWENFKKFLKDYSLIKEHPPESIAIWNQYLVYATALGVADEVYKAMKLHVYSSGDDYYYNDVYMFYYLGGYHHINDSFNIASSTISAADNSSIGDIGGGSGGGGGGAF